MNPRRHSSIHRLLMLFGILAALIPVASLLPPTLLTWEQASADERGVTFLQHAWPWLAAALAGGLLAVLLTLWLARQLQRPLRDLQRDLAKVASRQNGEHLPRYQLSELDQVAQAVNQLNTGRMALASNVERLTERLVQMQTLASLGQIAVGIAHDLNNPLTTILGLADIIQSSELDEDTRRDIAVIRRQAERSGGIVRGLLSFARRQRDEPQWVSLNELITQTLDLLAYQARVGSIRCETHLDDGLPLVWADPSPIQQVFFNLIINAMQAMAEAHGRGNLRIETSWTPAESGPAQGQVVVHIRDDGPGIAENVLPKLFQPYFTTRGSSGGTGLGLSIAADIVRRHHGRISAESNPRGGACFKVQLPIAPEGPQAQAPAASERPGHILLADSDPQELGLLAQVLRRLGYRLSTAGDGLLARSKIEEELPDVVICRLEMARLSGRELHAWACTHRPELAGRFVFIGRNGTNGEVEELGEAGAWMLEPPFREETIRQAIGQALRLA